MIWVGIVLLVAAVVAFLMLAKEPIRPPVTPDKTGGRLLGIAITSGEESRYEEALQAALRTGIQVGSAKLSWDECESQPGVYASTWIEPLRQLHLATGLRLDLRLAPIDTGNFKLPSDLAGRSLADPEVIERFSRFAEWVLGQFHGVEITALAIGNEVDTVLKNDPQLWDAFQTFFAEVSRRLKLTRPNLRMGTPLTFDAYSGPNRDQAAALSAIADIVMVNYYPLGPGFQVKSPEAIRDDLNAINGLLVDGKWIHLTEIGCPSGEICGSSLEKQREFIEATFSQWDQSANRIELMMFVWLDDLPGQQVQAMTREYHVEERAFADYLSSLGLRTNKGIAKPAFQVLNTLAHERGW